MEQSKEETELEKAAEKYARIAYAKAHFQPEDEAVYAQTVSEYSFKAGAEWQQSQQVSDKEADHQTIINLFKDVVKDKDTEIRDLKLQQGGDNENYKNLCEEIATERNKWKKKYTELFERHFKDPFEFTNNKNP